MAIASKALAALALAAGTAACAPYAPYMGEALKYDMALQTIDPDPVYPPDSAEPGDNGDHGRAAAERYRKGTVTQVVQESTTSSVGEAGGK